MIFSERSLKYKGLFTWLRWKSELKKKTEKKAHTPGCIDDFLILTRQGSWGLASLELPSIIVFSKDLRKQKKNEFMVYQR